MASDSVFPGITPGEEELLKAESRQKCLEDLHYLTKYVLGYRRVTDHYHRLMCKDIDNPRYRFKLLLHPRGHFKSTLGTESYSILKLLRNPNERILIDNAKLDNSRKFLRAISHHFHSNALFRWIWRDWWIKQYATDYHRAEFKDKLDWVVRDVQDEFTLLRPYEGREASITTGAVDASLVSQHYSVIIADDLINRDYVTTPEMVEKSILHFRDLLDLLDPDGELLIIGTRWAHMDLYDWIIKEFGGIASLRVPQNYVSESIVKQSTQIPEEQKQWLVSIQPCIDDNGQPVFPEEFNQEVLAGLQQAKGPYEFGAQYLLNPTPRESQKFADEWFRKIDRMPDVSTLYVCITVDPAKSISDEADNTAIAVCGYNDKNEMFFIDGRDEKMTVDELLEEVFGLAQKYDRFSRLLLPVGVEAIAFQEVLVYNLERMMMERDFFFKIEPIKRRQQSKEERILRLVPRIKNGFYMPRSIIKEPVGGREPPYDLCQRLVYQLTRFPFAGKDDLADALADQLDIAKASKLPAEVLPERPEPKRDFTHWSVIEDRRRVKLYTADNPLQ